MRSLFSALAASIVLVISGAAAAADGGVDSGADASADAGGDAEVDAALDASSDALGAQDGPSDAYVSDVGVITYPADGANPSDDAGSTGSVASGCSCSIAGSAEDGSTPGAGPASALGAFGVAFAVARRRRRRR